MNQIECLIVGAGIASLALARALRQKGRAPVVLERSSSVGGRVGTRNLDGASFDYGPVFFHGRDPLFVRFFTQQEPDKLILGWPNRIKGRGLPCQPEAFDPNQTRWAWRGGLRPVLQQLGQLEHLHLEEEVSELRLQQGSWELVTVKGHSWRTPNLFLCLAHEQNLLLLRQVDHPSIQNLLDGLSQHSSMASLSLAAHYRRPASMPEWDIWYPEESNLILISNETSKHGGEGLTLVFQAKPVWSRNRVDKPKETWAGELLQEAQRLLGDWAGLPDLTHPHRWRYARMDSASYLPRPFLTQIQGCWLGLAGDLFQPNRGLEASWLSGLKLADEWSQAVTGS